MTIQSALRVLCTKHTDSVHVLCTKRTDSIHVLCTKRTDSIHVLCTKFVSFENKEYDCVCSLIFPAVFKKEPYLMHLTNRFTGGKKLI